jgi:hypothetical protein
MWVLVSFVNYFVIHVTFVIFVKKFERFVVFVKYVVTTPKSYISYGFLTSYSFYNKSYEINNFRKTTGSSRK